MIETTLFSCPKCNKPKVKRDPTGKDYLVMTRCDCPKMSDEEAHRKREEFKMEANFQRVEKLRIPHKYTDKTFENYQRKYCPDAHDRVKEWCKGRKWLLVHGIPGTGKTHLAYAAQRTITLRGGSCRYATMSAVVAEVTEANFAQKQAIKDNFVNTWHLIFDEIGIERTTESATEIVYEILNRRYEHERPTLLLSNLNPKELNARNDAWARIVERLIENGAAVEMTGKSRRGTVEMKGGALV